MLKAATYPVEKWTRTKDVPFIFRDYFPARKTYNEYGAATRNFKDTYAAGKISIYTMNNYVMWKGFRFRADISSINKGVVPVTTAIHVTYWFQLTHLVVVPHRTYTHVSFWCRRERLVSASHMPVYGDQLVTPVTTIGLVIWVVVLCPFPVSSLGWPCLPAVAIYGTVNRGSEFTHMRVGPVGYHNKMRQLESTCDRRLWLCWPA